jgi:valyl-tRNA synthetase
MSEVPEKLTKPYDPAQTEGRIYKLWEDSGFFNPDNLPARHTEPYTIIMPPSRSKTS